MDESMSGFGVARRWRSVVRRNGSSTV